MKTINKAGLCLCLALLLTLSIFSSGIVFSASSDSEDSRSLEELEAMQRAATERRQLAEQSLREAEQGKKGALAEKEAIDKKINALENELTATENLIHGYEQSAAQKKDEIRALEEELESLYDTVKLRIRSHYEDGDADYLEMLFDSGSMVEFFTHWDRFTCMLDYDERLMNGYQDGLSQLKEREESMKASIEALNRQKKAQEDRRAELNADLKKVQAMIDAEESDIESAKQKILEYQQLEESYNQAREEKLAELSRQQPAPISVQSEYHWPLESKYEKISCGFGPRIHPVTGLPQFHKGIDIPAPYGTNIMAVNDGVVSEVSYNGADGYYVLISHGNGVASFYSHLSQYFVSVGDTVAQGQVIAQVGTSGWVTGAHLNLNMYRNNEAVDPLSFFTAYHITFY